MALVQSTGLQIFDNVSSGTLTLTGVSASNALIIVLAEGAKLNSTPTGFSVAVNPAVFTPTGGEGGQAAIFYNQSPSSGTNAVTLSWPASTFAVGAMIEWSGLAATALDVTNSANTTG